MSFIIEYFTVQNREVLALAAGVIVFMMTYHVLIRVWFGKRNLGLIIILSTVIAIISGRELYVRNFLGYEVTLTVLLIAALIGLGFRLIYPFFKFGKRQFR